MQLLHKRELSPFSFYMAFNSFSKAVTEPGQKLGQAGDANKQTSSPWRRRYSFLYKNVLIRQKISFSQAFTQFLLPQLSN
jgi:hypothetical protein